MSLSKKIDFMVIFSVNHANPNGDPLNGNRPRTTLDNLGEMSDVCLKRKMRNRLMAEGAKIFVQPDESKVDNCKSLRERAESTLPAKGTPEEVAKIACETWFDVRAFGQVFAYSAGKKGAGLSVGVRGPVSIHPAFSVETVDVISSQITKSVNSEPSKSGDDKKSSDTMGMKHRVEKGIYSFYGSISPQLAHKTGFSDEDAEKLKGILSSLFEGDASSARPDGSMEVINVLWWEHNSPSGQYSSAKVHRSVEVKPDGSYTIEHALENLEPQVIGGF